MTVERPPVAVTYISLVPGKVRFGEDCLDAVEAEANAVVRKLALLDDAPFTWIHIVMRLGSASSEPAIGRVNRRYGDLPVSIDVPMATVLRKTRSDTCRVIARATSRSLRAVADKYRLGSTAAREKLSEMGGTW